MVALTYCVLCEELQQPVTGGYDLKGVFITPVYAKSLPAHIPVLVVVMSFAIGWEDVGHRVRVTVDILDQADVSILTGKLKPDEFYLELDRSKIVVPERTQGVLLQTRAENIILPREGMYSVVVSIDGAKTGSVPLFLVAIPPQPRDLQKNQL